MYRVAEMEDVLFGTFEDLSKVLDVYLNKKSNNNKTPIWIKDFEHSYAIIDDKKVVVACFCIGKSSIKGITIADNLKEPVSHIILETFNKYKGAI